MQIYACIAFRSRVRLMPRGRHCWSCLMLLCWIPMIVTCVIVILDTILFLYYYLGCSMKLISYIFRHLLNWLFSAQAARELRHSYSSCSSKRSRSLMLGQSISSTSILHKDKYLHTWSQNLVSQIPSINFAWHIMKSTLIKMTCQF